MVIRPADHGIFASSAAGETGAGYAVSGYGSGGPITAIQRLSMPGNTFSTIAAVMSVGTYEGVGFSNNAVAGYAGGGPSQTFIDKLTYSDETRATLAATYGSSAAYSPANGCSNDGTAGYKMGGNTLKAIDKLLYSNDTNSTLAAVLSENLRQGYGASDSGTAAYRAGGATAAWTTNTPTDVIDKLLYSNDTVSTLGATMSVVGFGGTGLANTPTAGYFSTGSEDAYPTNYLTTVDKLDFSGASVSTLGTGLSSSRGADSTSLSNNGVAGYIGGTGSINTWDMFTFSTDVRSILATGLPTAAGGAAAFANCADAGGNL